MFHKPSRHGIPLFQGKNIINSIVSRQYVTFLIGKFFISVDTAINFDIGLGLVAIRYTADLLAAIYTHHSLS